MKEIPFQFGKIIGDFYCDKNNLTSLKDGPEKVGGYFDCSENNLTSLKGCSKEVNGDFYCDRNKIKFTEEDVKKVCKVGKKIIV